MVILLHLGRYLAGISSMTNWDDEVAQFGRLSIPQNLNSEGYASIPPSDTEHENKNMFFISKVKVLEFMGSFEILNGIILYTLKRPI